MSEPHPTAGRLDAALSEARKSRDEIRDPHHRRVIAVAMSAIKLARARLDHAEAINAERNNTDARAGTLSALSRGTAVAEGRSVRARDEHYRSIAALAAHSKE